MKLIKPVQAIIENPTLKNSTVIQGDPQKYVNDVIQTLISILFIFGLIYFIVHFVLAGFHMISSQGDPKKYEEAQKALLYSLMGIAIIFSIFAILKVIGTIFGIDGLGQLKVNFPSL